MALDSCCPHPVQDHDRVALRYCEATVAGALQRGCICRPSAAAGAEQPQPAVLYGARRPGPHPPGRYPHAPAPPEPR